LKFVLPGHLEISLNHVPCCCLRHHCLSTGQATRDSFRISPWFGATDSRPMNLNLVSGRSTQVVCQMLNSRAHVGRNRVLGRRPVLRPDKIWNLHRPGHGVRETPESVRITARIRWPIAVRFVSPDSESLLTVAISRVPRMSACGAERVQPRAQTLSTRGCTGSTLKTSCADFSPSAGQSDGSDSMRNSS